MHLVKLSQLLDKSAQFLRISTTILPLLLLTLAGPALHADNVDWLPVDEEDLATSTPSVDPDAGAEVLFTNISVDDWDENDHNFNSAKMGQSISYDVMNLHRVQYSMYRRIKVFNERGVEQLRNSQDFFFDPNQDHLTVAARVMKPDGTVSILDEKDIYTREVFRFGERRTKMKSFAFPGLMPGCIVDVICTNRAKGWASGYVFEVNNRLPVRKACLRIRPSIMAPWIIAFDGCPNPMKKNKLGWVETEVRNIASIYDEKFLPGDVSVRPWITVSYFETKELSDSERFWGYEGNRIDKLANRKIRSGNSRIKEKADELTQGVTDPTERLKRIYDFCTHEIVNLSGDNSGFSLADLEGTENNDDATRTLKTGKGTAYDITILFASLAKASGANVTFAFCNDRMLFTWKATVLTTAEVSDLIVAVKNKGKWTYYCPGEPYVPFGMLAPGNEGTIAIIGTPGREALVKDTPITPSSLSQVQRSATLSIAEDGTLSGSITEKHTGHKARTLKKLFADMTPSSIADEIVKTLHEQMPSADVTDVKLTNLKDPDKDVEITYNVTVPGYADVSRERIFVQPCYFEKGKKPTFTNAQRSWDIRFPYAWETHDVVRLSYPANYEIEEGAAPNNLMGSEELNYRVTLGKSRTKPVVVYRRDNTCNVLEIPSKLYEGFKTYTDSIHREDGHVLTLKRINTPAETAPSDEEVITAGKQSANERL